MYRKPFHMDPMISSINSNEYVNSITHLIGTILAIAGTAVLIVLSALAAKPIHIISFSIYGLTLILSFLFSTIMHFNLLFGRYKRILGILDHNAIYLLIAGTYTPFCLIVLDGALGWWVFGIIWSMATLFISIKSIFFEKLPIWLSQATFIAMGWLMVVFAYFIYTKLGIGVMLWILVGGLFYTIGSLIFQHEKPDPWPPFFGNHEIWHLCVIFGNATFFFVMLFYILPH